MPVSNSSTCQEIIPLLGMAEFRPHHRFHRFRDNWNSGFFTSDSSLLILWTPWFQPPSMTYWKRLVSYRRLYIIFRSSHLGRFLSCLESFYVDFKFRKRIWRQWFPFYTFLFPRNFLIQTIFIQNSAFVITLN